MFCLSPSVARIFYSATGNQTRVGSVALPLWTLNKDAFLTELPRLQQQLASYYIVYHGELFVALIVDTFMIEIPTYATGVLT